MPQAHFDRIGSAKTFIIRDAAERMAFGNARLASVSTALTSDAAQSTIEDFGACDLPPADDTVNAMLPERDPWKEEEAADQQRTRYLPITTFVSPY